jgi:hypothetical protein
MLSPMMQRQLTQVELRRELELANLLGRQMQVRIAPDSVVGACQACGGFDTVYMVQVVTHGIQGRLCPECIRTVRS